MELHLAQLLTNNDPPSDATIHKVEEVLLTPLQELEETNLEIANLEARVQFLKEKRDTIQSLIDKYRTILSPVRRIHADILHEIFYHCLPTHRHPILNASEAPILLTWVCSTWRSIALSSPRLWAQFHLGLSDNYGAAAPPQSPNGIDELDHYDPHLQSRARRILKLRSEVVSEWLIRSGTCPLSISISYSSNAWTSEDLETFDEGDLTMELFKTLSRFGHRWRSLELTMPIEIYRKLDAMISNSADMLKALTDLKLSFHIRLGSTALGGALMEEPIALFKAPRLTRVSLSGPGTQTGYWGFRATPFAEWARHLTYLCCNVSFSVIDGFNLLKQCSNLVHCRLYISNMPDIQSIQNPDGIIWSHGVASLPRLLSLSITNEAMDTTMAPFYSSLDAPRLKWIHYRLNVSGYHLPDGAVPIFNLLQKSTELRKLNIEPQNFSSVNLQRILEIVSPTLMHLVLGQEVVLPLSAVTATQRSPLRPFRLNWLVVDPELEVDSSSAPPRRNTLLPHLEILESSFEMALDNTLLRFITGRMDPSSPSGVAALKRVRIIFDRVKEIDVVEQVAQYREAHMATNNAHLDEIKLELCYRLDPPIVPTDPLSSSYGLGRDGRSWRHEDIDESLTPK